jgi:hypothetical protein
MQKHSALLCRSLGRSNNVYNGAELGKRARYRIETGQLCFVLGPSQVPVAGATTYLPHLIMLVSSLKDRDATYQMWSPKLPCP